MPLSRAGASAAMGLGKTKFQSCFLIWHCQRTQGLCWVPLSILSPSAATGETVFSPQKESISLLTVALNSNAGLQHTHAQKRNVQISQCWWPGFIPGSSNEAMNVISGQESKWVPKKLAKQWDKASWPSTSKDLAWSFYALSYNCKEEMMGTKQFWNVNAVKYPQRSNHFSLLLSWLV